MKHPHPLAPLAVASLSLLLCGFLVAQEDNPLDKFKRAYEQAMALATEPLEGLNARYVEELGKLKEKAQNEGTLEKTLLVQDEIESYAGGKERDFAAFPELLRLRKIYDENTVRLQASAQERRTDIMRQSVGKLDEMTKSLTKAGNVEVAVRAEAFRQEILAQLGGDGSADAPAPRQTGEFNATVPATADKVQPLETKVALKAGDRFQIIPNQRDKWSGGGSKRNESCDFRGYEDSRVNWMRMFWRIGDGKPTAVDPEAIGTAEADGALLLYAEDTDPGGNEGKIRVKILVNPEQPGQ